MFTYTVADFEVSAAFRTFYRQNWVLTAAKAVGKTAVR